MTKRTAIVIGAGPIGLVTAHGLVTECEFDRVHVYDFGADPTTADDVDKDRAWQIGLHLRGLTVLQNRGLLDQIQDLGVPNPGLCVVNNGRVIKRERPAGCKRSFRRADLVQSLAEAVKRGPAGPSITFHYHTECDGFDATTREVIVHPDGGTPQRVTADLIVGCDGINSAIRTSLEDSALVTTERNRSLWHHRVIHTEPGVIRDEGWIQLLPTKGGVAQCSPTIDGRYACTIAFTEKMMDSFPHLSATVDGDNDDANRNREAMHEHVAKFWPDLAPLVSDASIDSYYRQRVSTTLSVHVRDRAQPDLGVVLLGDAGQGTHPSLGQSLNAGFQCVEALLSALGRNDDIAVALAQFMSETQGEVDAVREMSEGMSHSTATRGKGGVIFSVLHLIVTETLNKLAPSIFPMYMTRALTETMDSYADVQRRHATSARSLKAVPWVLIGSLAFALTRGRFT